MMRLPGVRLVAFLCVGVFILALSACGGGGSSSNTGPSAPSLSSISVGIPCPPGPPCKNPGGPPTAFLKVGNIGAFTVIGVYKDGTTKDLTSLVNWASSDTSVATVSTSGMATGVSGGTVTVTADYSTLSNSKTLTVIPPLTILLSPSAGAVKVGSTQPLAASGKFGDGTLVDLTRFTNWSSASVSHASVDSGGVVSGIARGVTTISASNSGVTGSTLLNVTDKSFSNASLNGRYAFTLTSPDSRGPGVESGSITANGNGSIASGTEDANTAAGVSHSAVTGTYAIQADGRGVVFLTINSATRSFNIALKANSATSGDNSGELIQSDTQANAIGTLEPQDVSAFNNAALASHTFAFRVGGLGSNSGPYLSRLGLITTDAAGTNLTGRDDISNGGAMTSNPVITGTMGAVDSSTGRVTVALDSANYVAYVVSSSKLHIIGVDAPDALAGVAERQLSTSPVSAGGYVMAIEIGGTHGTFWIVGQFDVSGTGVADGVLSQNPGSELAISGGSLTVGSDGQGTLHAVTDHGNRDFIVYVVSTERMLVLQSGETHAASGVADLQHPGPGASFAANSLNGDFKFSAAGLEESNLTFLGQLVADGNGNLAGIEDLSSPHAVSDVALDGTYTVSPNGQTVIAVNPETGVTGLTLYLVSPSKGYYWGSSGPDVNGVMELQ